MGRARGPELVTADWAFRHGWAYEPAYAVPRLPSGVLAGDGALLGLDGASGRTGRFVAEFMNLSIPYAIPSTDPLLPADAYEVPIFVVLVHSSRPGPDLTLVARSFSTDDIDINAEWTRMPGGSEVTPEDPAFATRFRVFLEVGWPAEAASALLPPDLQEQMGLDPALVDVARLTPHLHEGMGRDPVLTDIARIELRDGFILFAWRKHLLATAKIESRLALAADMAERWSAWAQPPTARRDRGA